MFAGMIVQPSADEGACRHSGQSCGHQNDNLPFSQISVNTIITIQVGFHSVYWYTNIKWVAVILTMLGY